MPSSVLSHTVPPFYACYFLRSLSVPSSTYIGSTPSPTRRKRQHNGEITQGVWRTTRSRPWEMECIVYGFASKIAALQFEWAWAKPHVSRHLRAVNEASGSSKAAFVPLFPATSLTPAFTKYGKPKRQRPKPPSSPNSRLLVLRALLRSEPFSGWGLRVAFFTEWSYGAFQRLEHQRKQGASANTSRAGRTLHDSYPQIVCDFRGVDGQRKAIALLSEQERKELGLKDALSSASARKKTDSKGKAKETGEATGAWPEELPRSANVKALGLTLEDIASAPVSMPSIPIDDTKLATTKRKRKAAEPSLEELKKRILQEDADQQLGPRMVLNDDDLAELQWRRFEASLEAADLSLDHLLDSEVASSKGQSTGEVRTAVPCDLCQAPVNLLDHLSYSTCPSPFPELTPRPLQEQTPSATPPEAAVCDSVFHLTCLAGHFLASTHTPHASEDFVLPTHGVCPNHSGELAYWSDVLRATFRRRDRFAQLVKIKVNNGVVGEAKAAVDEDEDEDEERGEDDDDDEMPISPVKSKAKRSKAAAPKKPKAKVVKPTKTSKSKRAVSEDSDSSLSDLPIRQARKTTTSASVAPKAKAKKATPIDVIDLT